MKKKPSAAAQARAAFNPKPWAPSKDLPRSEPRRSSIEEARPPPGVRLLSRQEVVNRVSLTYPTIWKMMREGRFPRARELMDGRIAWIESEVEQWIESLPIRKFKGDEVDA